MMRRMVTSSGIALRQPPMRIAMSTAMSSSEGAVLAIAAPTSGLDCIWMRTVPTAGAAAPSPSSAHGPHGPSE